MLKFVVLIFQREFFYTELSRILKENESKYVEEMLISVVSFIMWSLLSEELWKSLIERVHWIYKCVYVSLRMRASVNLVVLSKPVDWVTE